MYDEYYGLTGRPFQLTPDPLFYFESATHRILLQAAAENSWFMLRIPGHRSPIVRIREPWASYLEGKSSNFRYTLKRKQRALEKLGEVTEISFGDVASVDRLLVIMERIEAASWKKDASMAITGSAEETRYYHRLLPWLAGKGALEANAILIDSVPAAYSLGCVWRGRVGQLKTFSGRFHGLGSRHTSDCSK